MEGEEGCDVSIVAKVSGCPFPTLTWQKASLSKPEEKAVVQYDQHINKLVTQDKCTLLIQQASRQDSALYSLTASNSLGTVTKEMKLSVLGETLWLLLPTFTSHSHCSYLQLLRLATVVDHHNCSEMDPVASFRTSWTPHWTNQVHRSLC